MDWLDRMNSSIDYIETHLSGTIDYDQAAKIACCSTYHFQRMFSFITNVTLAEYVRRRRLTLAAFELQNRGVKVIDVALKYGYESPEAFSRAFKKMHGVMPKSAGDNGLSLKAYPRLSFHISIRGDGEINYKIEDKSALEMFGVSTFIHADGGKPYVEIPEFWKKCISDGTVKRIRAAAGLGEHGQIHAVIHDMQGETFSYMIGYFLPQGGLPHGYELLQIPPQTCAVFSTGIHPDGGIDIHHLWRRIWGEWFPTCDYESTSGPQFEMTYDRGNGLFEMEVWIPVVKKSR